MADQDDTSKLNTPRRNQRKTPTAPSSAVPPTAVTRETPPRTLEEAIENVRALLIEVRGILHLLSDVLVHADDDDAVMHAEVAKASEGWISDAAARLDLVTLRPLIEAIRQGGEGSTRFCRNAEC